MEHAHRGGGYATREGGLWLPTEINSNKAECIYIQLGVEEGGGKGIATVVRFFKTS